MKIFCIGLNKTGTSSLHAALDSLGFRSLHGGRPELTRTVERALEEGRPLVEDFPLHDAFSDIWVLSENFDVLDEQYPGSRFILTTRDLDDWLDARRRHVERNRANRERGLYHGTFLTVDLDSWRELHRAHHARVLDYFAGRADFLAMRVVDGDGYEKLCPFLALPVPDRPFPNRNRSDALPT